MQSEEPRLGLEVALVVVGIASAALLGGAAATAGNLGLALLAVGAVVGQLVGLKRVDQRTAGALEEDRATV